jgi:hypothetical protein
MKFGKYLTTALVAGAGLALAASAFAQSAGTFTSSDDGIDDSVSITVAASTTQFTHTFTSGGAAAIAIATPIGVGGAGVSIPAFSYADVSSTSASSSSGTGPTSFTSSTSASTTLSTSDNGRSATDAFNRDAIFVHADETDEQGSDSTTSTHSTGLSLSALFVFAQTIAVDDGTLTGDTGNPYTVTANNVADNVAGSLALNQVAGVGNQQGNNLSTVAEIAAGSNAVENEGRQTIAINGTVEEEAIPGATGDSATLGGTTGSVFGTIAGAVAANQAVGVGNQQVNNITLAH